MNIKRPLYLLCLAFTAAVWLFLKLSPPDQYTDASIADDSTVSFTGTVMQKELKTDFQGKKVLVIYLRDVLNDETSVQCYMNENMSMEPHMGEKIRVTGQIRNFPRATNPGEFDSRQYYSILKIKYQIKNTKIVMTDGKADLYSDTLYKIRCYFSHILDLCLNEQDASIMKAMLLGNRTDLDSKTSDMYRQSGIIHILAISGLHISIIGMGIYTLLRKCRIKILPASCFVIAFMWSYGVMCGMSTSAFRAVIMFGLRLLSKVFGRTYDMLTGLAVAAVLVLVEQPQYLSHTGFLMSFGAIIGIGMILPSIQPLLTLPSVIRKRFGTFFSGTAVSLVTIPVYTNFFFTFPVYAVFLNLLILPLMSIIMVMGLLCLGLGSVAEYAGIFAGWGIHYILAFYWKCCEISMHLAGNTWYVGHSNVLQTGIYLIMLMVFVYVTEQLKRHIRKREDRKDAESSINRQKLIFEFRYLWLIAAIVILTFHVKPSMKITFLDVGQGDGIVVESKKAAYLIDGGSTSKKNLGKYQLIPYLAYEGIGKLDAVILTHEDEDHMSGIMEIMEKIPTGGVQIKELILPDIAEQSKGENYLQLESKAKSLQIPISYISRGEEVQSGKLQMTCLGPAEKMETTQPNAYSTVMLLQYGKFKAFLTGDVDGDGQEYLKAYLRDNQETVQDITLLKVAHHGSRYTTDNEFLELCKPKYAVISCGRKNRYGHPHAELLKRLSDANIETYITRDSGAVTVISDGEKMNIQEFTEKYRYAKESVYR